MVATLFAMLEQASRENLVWPSIMKVRSTVGSLSLLVGRLECL